MKQIKNQFDSNKNNKPTKYGTFKCRTVHEENENENENKNEKKITFE